MGMPNAGSPTAARLSSPKSLAIRQSSDESPVTVVVADDHPVILEGLIKILNSQKDIRVVASAADGEEVRKLYYQFLPDVLILDLRLPKKDGLQVLNELMARGNSKPRVIIISTFDCEQAIFQTVRAGAKAYLAKVADPQEIREAVRRVAKGETFFPSEIGLKLAKAVSSPRLSKREMEVLESLARGKRNREIAHALDVSEGTIKYHVKSILRKLKVIGRAEAIAVATKRGIIQAPTQHLRTYNIVPVVKVERSNHQWSFTNVNTTSITPRQTKVVV